MSIKRALIISILAILLNAASLYNAVMAVWSLVLLIFSIFVLNFRDRVQQPRDRKVFGFIQLFMLIIISFMSTVIGFLGVYQLWFVVNHYLSPVVPLSIALTACGAVLYYYFLIKLIQEAYGVFTRKGVSDQKIEEQRVDGMNEQQKTFQSGQETIADHSSKMKARYIILIAILSIIVNFLSVYNFYLGICSIFVLFIASITALFVTLVNRANKVPSKWGSIAQQNMSQYGTLKVTQVTNKIAILFGLVLVYIGGVVFTILQIKEREQLHKFLLTHVSVDNVHTIANILSIIGYALFAIALLFVTIYCIRMMRSEQMFVGKAS